MKGPWPAGPLAALGTLLALRLLLVNVNGDSSHLNTAFQEAIDPGQHSRGQRPLGATARLWLLPLRLGSWDTGTGLRSQV